MDDQAGHAKRTTAWNTTSRRSQKCRRKSPVSALVYTVSIVRRRARNPEGAVTNTAFAGGFIFRAGCNRRLTCPAYAGHRGDPPPVTPRHGNDQRGAHLRGALRAEEPIQIPFPQRLRLAFDDSDIEQLIATGRSKEIAVLRWLPRAYSIGLDAQPSRDWHEPEPD
jgi:hypothetical protein